MQAVGAPTENTGANADADNVSEQIAENTSAVNRNTQDSPLESRAQLTKNLAEAEQYINTLDKAYQDQSELVLSYENGMQSTTAKLRDYIYEQQQATLGKSCSLAHYHTLSKMTCSAIHSHYTSLLQASRNETMQAQLTHQAWQTSFSRVSETLREALKHHTLVTAPYKRKVAALKEENRTLRARVGWDPPSDSEDELEGRFEKERATAPLVSENVTALP